MPYLWVWVVVVFLGYLRLVAEKIEDKQSKLTTSSNGHGHGHLFEVLPWI